MLEVVMIIIQALGNCEEYCFSEANGALPSWNLGYNTIAASRPHFWSKWLFLENITQKEPLRDFVGCPINGTWTISVQDNILADDG